MNYGVIRGSINRRVDLKTIVYRIAWLWDEKVIVRYPYRTHEVNDIVAFIRISIYGNSMRDSATY